MVEQVDWTVVERFLGFVWRVALQYNASVKSGCRSSVHNLEVGGHPQSKHTFHGGWGMGVDLWFDDPDDRPKAIERLAAAGYHPVVKSHYKKQQLHVQGWAFGEEPLWREI